MPTFIVANLDPATRNLDPLRNYRAFYSLLTEYRKMRDKNKLLITQEAVDAAKKILDIDEDVKESYGKDTDDLVVDLSTCAGMVVYAMNNYRRNLRLFGWAIEPKVLWHAQIMIDEAEESNKIEESMRAKLVACRNDFEVARNSALQNLTLYVARWMALDETHRGPQGQVDARVLVVVEAISKWAAGKHQKVPMDTSLRSKNLRNWGYDGYTAKMASIYYWALRKTREDVDEQVLLAVQDVLDLAARFTKK